MCTHTHTHTRALIAFFISHDIIKPSRNDTITRIWHYITKRSFFLDYIVLKKFKLQI